MKEELQDQNFNKLIEVLLLDLAFYIPKSIINASILNQIEEYIPEGYFDSLSILDPRGFGEFDILEINERLLKKRIELEKNIFTLINLHKEQKDKAFDYMFYKYLDQLVFYRAIANWLDKNLEHFFEGEIDLVTKGVFVHQFQLYNTHLIELIEEFSETHQIELKEEFTIEELLSVYIPEMISRYGLTSYEETETKTVTEKKESSQIEDVNTNEKTTSKVTNIKKSKEKKSKPDINEQEIEDFLFETVFGV